MLQVANLDCLLIQCRFSLEVTSVILETPNVEIISQDDLNLDAKIDMTVTKSLNSTLVTLQGNKLTCASLTSRIKRPE